MRIWKRYRRQPWNATRSQDIVIMFLFFWMKKVVPQIMLWISIDLFCGQYHVFFDSKEGHQMMSLLEAQKNVDQFVLELFSEWVIYLSEIIIHCYDNPIGCCFIRWFRYNNTTTLSPPILDGILSICWSGVIPLQAGVTGVWLSFCQSAMTYILRVRRAQQQPVIVASAATIQTGNSIFSGLRQRKSLSKVHQHHRSCHDFRLKYSHIIILPRDLYFCFSFFDPNWICSTSEIE